MELCNICKYRIEDCDGEHCGHCGFNTFDKFELDYRPEKCKQPIILEKDGTLVVTTELYEKVTRVLVQNGTKGTLFYQDNE